MSNQQIWSGGHGASVGRPYMVLKCYLVRFFSRGIIMDFSLLLGFPVDKIDGKIFFIWGWQETQSKAAICQLGSEHC